jgi:hypothetical protein
VADRDGVGSCPLRFAGARVAGARARCLIRLPRTANPMAASGALHQRPSCGTSPGGCPGSH